MEKFVNERYPFIRLQIDDYMDILDKIEGLEAKFHEVSLLITDPAVIADQVRYVRLNREYHDLERVLASADRYKKAIHDLDEAKQIFFNESDSELKEMARAEIDLLEPQIPALEEEVKLMLLPQDPEDGKNVVMEIRGGTGGDEAALFAGDLFRMYTKYFELHGFKYFIGVRRRSRWIQGNHFQRLRTKRLWHTQV